MKAILAIVLIVAALLLAAHLLVQRHSGSQLDAELYITKSEQQWAESLADGDTSVVERIVADDFQGVESDGTLYGKAQSVAETREGPKEFASNHANLVAVRFFGNSAIAQGSETFVKKTGAIKKGRYVWTDTWLKRNGKWQIVAAEDVLVPESDSVR